MKTKIIPIIIILIIIGAGAYYFDRYYLKNDTSKVIENAKTTETEVKNTNESLVYLAENDGVKEILSNDIGGKDKKVLFTDKNENLKIRTAGGLAYLSREALVFASSDGSQIGKFFIIKLDQSGKKDEIDNISESNALSISPDGELIAYVIFSNVEESYGNNILLINRKGENRREIFRSEDKIASISFSNNGKDIIFIKTNTSGKSVVSKVSIDTTKEKEIYSSANPISSISWSKEGKILLSKGDGKNEPGEIIEMDSNGGGSRKVLETKNSLVAYPNLSGDGLNIGYLEGDIKISTNLGQNIYKIGSGILILGWLP